MKPNEEGVLMRTMILALALVLPAVATATPRPDEPTYGVTAQFDDV